MQLSCGLSLYHWQTVVNLAWFSTLTHLTTLTSLRQYFHCRRVLVICRLITMGVVIILLSVAFLPTGHAWQPDYDAFHTSADPTKDPFKYLMSTPAHCLFSRSSTRLVIQDLDTSTPLDKRPGSHGYNEYDSGHAFNAPLVILSLAYLWISYLTRIVRLSKFLTEFSENCFRTRPMKFLQRQYQSIEPRKSPHKYRHSTLLYRAMLLLMLTLAEAIYETGDSILWEFLWLGAALAWGTLRLIGFRLQPDVKAEDYWGFGQILPLMLSLLPVWCFFNTFFDAEKRCANVTALPQDSATYLCPALQRIKRTTWFRFLTIMIIAKATVLAAYLLYLLPGSVIPRAGLPDQYGNLGMVGSGLALGMTLQAYVIILVFFSSI